MMALRTAGSGPLDPAGGALDPARFFGAFGILV
jgi:hypothetical protein